MQYVEEWVVKMKNKCLTLILHYVERYVGLMFKVTHLMKILL